MNSIFGLMATSGGNFVSIAHLEIPLLIKMLMCQILIFPAVYIYIYVFLKEDSILSLQMLHLLDEIIKSVTLCRYFKK